jgi:hypothetical protein
MFGDLQKDARAFLLRLEVTATNADNLLAELQRLAVDARAELAEIRKLRERIQSALGTP